jgi:hypothetical protein
VGYGDILAKTYIEKILCIFTMIIACGVFGFVMNNVGTIFQDIYKLQGIIDKKMFVINRFMNEKNMHS